MREQPYILLLIVALGMHAPVQAQQHYKRAHNAMLDEAKALLANGEYVNAARIYKKLLPVDTTFLDNYYELGFCLARLPEQRDKAVPYLQKAADGGHIEAMYELGLALHRQQRFDEAIDRFMAYTDIFHRLVDDPEVDRMIGMCRTAKELSQHPVELRVRNLGAMINSPMHDYCPQVTADGNTMYFTSRREGTTGGMKDPNGQYMEDIYLARRIDEVWTNAMNAGPPLNTSVQDATVGISPDGENMIIYRTAADMVSGDLFETRKAGDGWSTPRLMTDRINSNAHEPSATISPDGSEIIFTSDRDGGQGGRDLYRIRRLPDGSWSQPLNLGSTVNTPYDEDAPFLHSDGITLFFSSNGQRTMGGYDIFKTQCIDPDMNGWSTPENMGFPLNTVNDDIYFCLSDDGTTGYLSSERPGGLGGQDIYQVVFTDDQVDYVAVLGVITDGGEEPVQARLTVTDITGEEVIGVYNSNPRTGRYLMVLQPGGTYHMSVDARGFETREAEFTAKAGGVMREMALDITLIRNDSTARAAKPE